MIEEYNPSNFMTKFYSMLKNKNFQRIITYDEANAKIYIFDKEYFQIKILPYFFRHIKFTSFVRQLNHYGFKKLKSKSKKVSTFTHPTLLKGEAFLSIQARKKQPQLKQENDERKTIFEVVQGMPQFSNFNTIKMDQHNVESQDMEFRDEMRSSQLNVYTLMTQHIRNFVHYPFIMQNFYSQISNHKSHYAFTTVASDL